MRLHVCTVCVVRFPFEVRGPLLSKERATLQTPPWGGARLARHHDGIFEMNLTKLLRGKPVYYGGQRGELPPGEQTGKMIVMYVTKNGEIT